MTARRSKVVGVAVSMAITRYSFVAVMILLFNSINLLLKCTDLLLALHSLKILLTNI
jgi:hypothetical protein